MILSSMRSPAPLRILCVTNMWPRDDFPGYGAFVESQTESVYRRGVTVTVHVIDGRRNKLAYLAAALRFIFRPQKLRNYDLVHAHTGHCGVIAALQRATPVLVSYVGYDLYGTPRNIEGDPSLKSALEARIFRALPYVVAGTITKSAAMEALLPERMQAQNLVLPNGVDRDRFRPMSQRHARSELGWSPDEIVVLFAANPDNPRKRFDVAKAAVDSYRASGGSCEFRVAWGARPVDMPLYMNAADLLVHPSIAEGSPNVVKEALACNLPVIGSDAGDIPELLAGVKRCRVVERRGKAYADAMREVLGARGRSDGRDRTAVLDLDVVADKLVSRYREVAVGRQTKGD
jgi:glycosyltransferase involved in cell wall biosynthesis